MENKAEIYTYEMHKKRFFGDKGMHSIPAYLQEFILIDPESKSRFQKAYGTKAVGELSRIFNDLPSLDTKSIDEFAIEYLEEIKKGNFYDYTLNKIGFLLHEFIDCNQYLSTGNVNPYYGQLTEGMLATFAKVLEIEPDEFKEVFYGKPINQTKVMDFANQMVGALNIAITSRFMDILSRSRTPEGKAYSDFQNYAYYYNGYSLDKVDNEGLPLKIQELCLPDIQKLKFDDIVKGRNLNPKNSQSHQAILLYIEKVSEIIAKWENKGKKEPRIQTILDSLRISLKNARLYVEISSVPPDFIGKRKSMFIEQIDEEIAKLPKPEKKEKFTIFRKKSKEPEQHPAQTLLEELKEDVIHINSMEEPGSKKTQGFGTGV
ncbi:hypothetical protein ACNVED_04410 [Legionella sp. D16C41]|uniref:hypothetical protein n=1 Tax=Legionella sp. D16C41 TaxID=3402688 RepID=UPI003AF94315